MEPNYEQDGTRRKERRRDGKGEAQGKEGGTERQEKKGAKVEDEGSEKGNTCKEVDGQSTAGFLEDPRLPRGFSRLLIFADKRTSFQEPGGIIRGGRTRSLTQDEKPRLTTGPLFPRNVRTCRIMARGEKVEESSSSRAAAPGPEIIQSSSPVPTCSAAPSLPPAVFSLPARHLAHASVAGFAQPLSGRPRKAQSLPRVVSTLYGNVILLAQPGRGGCIWPADWFRRDGER